MRRPAPRLRFSLPLLIALLLAAPAIGGGPPADTATGPAPVAEDVPFRKGPVLSAASLVRVAAATAGGVLLVWVATLALRRTVFAGNAKGVAQRRIRVLETRRLSPRTTLTLVRVGDREVLLGQSGDRLVRLHAAAADSTHEPGPHD
jgi:hypothetical protein